MADYKLPDPGEGLTEAEIVTWRVAVGDVIEINDVVVEIETAKSLVELPSPYAGTVTALLVEEGQTVEVGTPIISIGDAVAAGGDEPDADGGDVVEPTDAVAQDAPTDEPIDTNKPPEGNPTLVGYGPREGSAKRRARKGPAAPPTEAGGSARMQVQGAFAPGGAQSDDVVESDEEPVPATSARAEEPDPSPQRPVRTLAKPPVRKLARDLGVDLASLSPTGPHGTVSREDVQAAADSTAAAAPSRSTQSQDPPAAGATAQPDEWREPVKGVRKMMAHAMVGSAFSAPHVTEWVTLDVTATMELVARLSARRELRDVRVGPLLVLAKAVTLAMRRTPEINSWFDDEHQEVVHRRAVNLGIAAATPRGLVVPNVKGAESLGLVDLAHELADLTATAREGRTQPTQMSGGTFTITNVGVFGIDAGTPIINPGESAILCFGAIRKQPWVVTTDGVDEIVPRQVTTLALSFDHRHIDGELGSRFLADVAGILADPGSALLF